MYNPLQFEGYGVQTFPNFRLKIGTKRTISEKKKYFGFTEVVRQYYLLHHIKDNLFSFSNEYHVHFRRIKILDYNIYTN